MYPILLATHSLFRWFVLLSLLYAIYCAFRGWFGNRPFTQFNNTVRHVTATMAHIQLTLGITIYCISPIIEYFFQNFKDALKIREVRFFGMEHSLMMFFAVVMISVGSAKAKRDGTDREKFRSMALWFTIGLLIILISIPWPFSPLASRPYYRSF